MLRLRLAPSALLMFLVLLSPVSLPTEAATFTVTNLNDSGPGSLRHALATAASGDTINFAVTGTILLSSGHLVIDKNLTIQGPGSSRLAIRIRKGKPSC